MENVTEDEALKLNDLITGLEIKSIELDVRLKKQKELIRELITKVSNKNKV